jgi:hypothetical protein
MQRGSAFRDYDADEDAREAVHVSCLIAACILCVHEYVNSCKQVQLLHCGSAVVNITCCAAYCR